MIEANGVPECHTSDDPGSEDRSDEDRTHESAIIPKRPGAGEPRPVPPSISSRTERISSALGFSAKILTAIVAGGFITLVAWETLRSHRLEFDKVDVPKTLADAGLSGEIIARRLRDAVVSIQGRFRTKMPQTEIAVLKDLPDITIPKADVSLESVAAAIRRFLPERMRHEVTGEVTLVGTQLSMLLRVNDVTVFFGTVASINQIDSLIIKSSYSILEYSVRQNIKLDPRNASAHMGLANLFMEQHKPEDAIAECRAAIQFDPKSSWHHNSLGYVLLNQHKLAEAIAEFRTAIQMNPKDDYPHSNLGDALRAQGKLDEALAEYHTAIDLDPKDSDPHAAVGNSLRTQGKLDEALAEYHTAIDLDPNLKLPRFRRVVLDLGDYGSVVTASIAAS